MPPPDKRTSLAEGKEALLQTYLNSYNQQQTENSTTVLAVNSDEDPEAVGVTYFVDEEGRYYYQPAGDSENLMSLASNTNEESENVDETETPVVVNGDGFQTVTLVSSEATNGEVSYVLVVQEESKPVVNINIKPDPQEEKSNDDVYVFEEEGGGEEEEDDAPAPSATRTPGKRKPARNNNFTCNFCSYTSPRRYLLLRHMKSHSEIRPYKCKICERCFKTLASLQNHLNMHNGVKPHVCKYCNTPFTTSGELVRHVRYKHTHEKPHKCSECDYASVELSKLRRHVRCHTGERPYQCPHCTYASPDTFKLKRHLRTHTGERPYKCDQCNMCFTQSNSLKAHKLIHTVSEKPVYACELCPAKCGRKTDLRIHVQKLHTSDKPLKCKRCGKSFPDRYSCKLHNKTHEGEKCFKCNLCLYASTSLRHLKSHMLKHTDEKPFVCDQCDQSFRQKQLLRRHQNIYHNPDYVPKPPKEKTHSCHECKRTFAHKGNLIRHLAVHDPDSGHQERALALKIGRQRKVQFYEEERERSSDGEQSSEVMKLNLGDNALQRGELVTVADGDGQQYVVLEVIQLEDEEHQVTVVAPDLLTKSQQQEQQQEEEEEEEEEEEMVEEEEEEEEEEEKPVIKEKKITIKQEDVDTCFGFDEEEAEEEDEVSYNDKVVLRLV